MDLRSSDLKDLLFATHFSQAFQKGHVLSTICAIFYCL